MNRILIMKNGPRASSVPLLGLFSILVYTCTTNLRLAFTGPLVLGLRRTKLRLMFDGKFW